MDSTFVSSSRRRSDLVRNPWASYATDEKREKRGRGAQTVVNRARIGGRSKVRFATPREPRDIARNAGLATWHLAPKGGGVSRATSTKMISSAHLVSLSRRSTLASFVSIASIATFASSADARLVSTGASQVTFVAIGPAGMVIHGTTPDISVTEDADRVKVNVPLSRLTTGIALRDRHMKEKYLEVARFPSAELVVARSALPLPQTSVDSSASGTMTLHGQSRAVTFLYKAKHDGSVFHVTGTVHVNMAGFGIQTPSYLGVSVKPDVEVSVVFDATQAP